MPLTLIKLDKITALMLSFPEKIHRWASDSQTLACNLSKKHSHQLLVVMGIIPDFFCLMRIVYESPSYWDSASVCVYSTALWSGRQFIVQHSTRLFIPCLGRLRYFYQLKYFRELKKDHDAFAKSSGLILILLLQTSAVWCHWAKSFEGVAC